MSQNPGAWQVAKLSEVGGVGRAESWRVLPKGLLLSMGLGATRNRRLTVVKTKFFKRGQNPTFYKKS
jgi:hypothetical protein